MKTKIQHLQKLKTELILLINEEDFLYRVEGSNTWFTPDYIKKSIQNICDEFLDPSKLEFWLQSYQIKSNPDPVNIVLAGNIPLVGFHDILCAYCSSSKVQVKISSKDLILTKRVIAIWKEIDPDFNIEFVERINTDAKLIATGSNSSFKYFEQYFGQKKNILRKNRTSIAVIHKEISDEELNLLMDDIFLYFGLGCRNVSKLWIEKGFELRRIFEASERYNHYFSHVKYMNNYDYQRTLMLLNKIDHLSNNFLMLKEDTNLFSPISTLFYEYYSDNYEIDNLKIKLADDIQCIIGRNHLPFGSSQKPSLIDYADGVDTMAYLND